MSVSALHIESEMRRQADPRHAEAKQFVRLCRSILVRGDKPAELHEAIAGDRLAGLAAEVAKSATAMTLDGAWGTEGGQRLAASYLASIADGSVLEAILASATVIPRDQHRTLVASGASANFAQQGAPKVVGRVGLDGEGMVEVKTTAMIVMSNELAASADPAASELFSRELRHATLAAMNEGCLALIPPGLSMPGTGDPVADLAVALELLSDSQAVVVAAQPGIVRRLAMASEGRMGLAGGEFVPGLRIVPIKPNTASPQMTLIAADRCAVTDLGLVVRGASHATVDFAATPSSPSQQVSLFQVGSKAILCERSFRLHAADACATVG